MCAPTCSHTLFLRCPPCRAEEDNVGDFPAGTFEADHRYSEFHLLRQYLLDQFIAVRRLCTSVTRAFTPRAFTPRAQALRGCMRGLRPAVVGRQCSLSLVPAPAPAPAPASVFSPAPAPALAPASVPGRHPSNGREKGRYACTFTVRPMQALLPLLLLPDGRCCCSWLGWPLD